MEADRHSQELNLSPRILHQQPENCLVHEGSRLPFKCNRHLHNKRFWSEWSRKKAKQQQWWGTTHPDTLCTDAINQLYKHDELDCWYNIHHWTAVKTVFIIYKLCTPSNITPSPSQTLKETKWLLEAYTWMLGLHSLTTLPGKTTRSNLSNLCSALRDFI